MPKEDFYAALDKFEEFMKNKPLRGQINLTGGEPLLHPNFFEFASEIRRRGFLLAILQAERLSEQNDLRRATAFFCVFSLH